jgi:hypothetical protein
LNLDHARGRTGPDLEQQYRFYTNETLDLTSTVKFSIRDRELNGRAGIRGRIRSNGDSFLKRGKIGDPIAFIQRSDAIGLIAWSV